MRLINLLFVLFTASLNAIALSVILNPYSDIDYDEPNAYPKHIPVGYHCHEDHDYDTEVN